MSNANTETTLVLGKEYDTRLWRVLREVLQTLGAIETENSWGIGGSQEIHAFSANIAGRALNIEAETYIGLSLTGPTELVHTVAQMVRDRMADGR
jgi:hypothetical protein